MLGMMWQSPKALDLLRDPRCVVHSVVSDREGSEGDFKLYVGAMDVQDAVVRRRYRETVKARIDWEPSEPSYHLFALDVESAGSVVFGTDAYGLAWEAGGRLRRWEQREF
jgi:hypothetical protein